MPRIAPLVSAFAVALAFSSTSAHALQRVFVSSTGLDTNPCTPTAPCRSFTQAMSVVDPGGEILALDSAGYGAVTVTKSVSILGNPGFYAGIAAGSGTAVTIATAGVDVILRGLNINGIGATTGISMTDGHSLTVENCVVSNFAGVGIAVTTASTAEVRIVNTLVRGNTSHGISLRPSAGTLTTDIMDTKVISNGGVGIWTYPNTTGGAITSVNNSVASSNTWGIDAPGTGLVSKVTVFNSTMSNNTFGGVQTEGGLITVGSSMISGNGTGMANSSGTLESAGNNTVRNNNAVSTGTITTVGTL